MDLYDPYAAGIRVTPSRGLAATGPVGSMVGLIAKARGLRTVAIAGGADMATAEGREIRAERVKRLFAEHRAAKPYHPFEESIRSGT